ncbi:MAG: ABC-2 family transporter protein [Nanoarchaeota archaeon]|nr:ABC-2 family transporter protein [Nanoarchaeota archaeon]
MGYLRFIKTYVLLNISTAMEYRLNFFLQSFFMILNNVAFILFWYFLFGTLDSINGWGLQDFVGLFGFAALSFGINAFFFGNWTRVGEIIVNGELDFYLSLPKDELSHILVSKSSFSGFGDMIFGIVILLLFYPITLTNVLIFVLGSLAGALIWAHLLVFAGTLSFWLGESSGFFQSLSHLTHVFTSYPSELFPAIIKMVFFFIFPVFFITNVNVFLLRDFQWIWVVGLVIVTFLVVALTRFVFKRGIRRYESGNLVTSRI